MASSPWGIRCLAHTASGWRPCSRVARPRRSATPRRPRSGSCRPSAAAKVDVTARTGRSSSRALGVHRPRSLPAHEVTTHHGIPVTTPARTLLDLAATLRRRPLERALDQAEIQGLTDVPSLERLARAHPGHHGAGKLAGALRHHTPGTT